MTQEEDEIIFDAIKLAKGDPAIQMAIRKSLTLCIKPNYEGIEGRHIETTIPDAIEFLRKGGKLTMASDLEDFLSELLSNCEDGGCDCDCY